MISLLEDSHVSQYKSCFTMNETEESKLSDFSPIHCVGAVLIVWDVVVTSIVLFAILKTNKGRKLNNFSMHIVSMSINDIGIGLFAIPRWLIKVRILTIKFN